MWNKRFCVVQIHIKYPCTSNRLSLRNITFVCSKSFILIFWGGWRKSCFFQELFKFFFQQKKKREFLVSTRVETSDWALTIFNVTHLHSKFFDWLLSVCIFTWVTKTQPTKNVYSNLEKKEQQEMVTGDVHLFFFRPLSYLANWLLCQKLLFAGLGPSAFPFFNAVLFCLR